MERFEDIRVWVGEVAGYQLLDSGQGEKLEEIAGIKIVRKEPRAWWQKSKPKIWNQELCKEKNFEKILNLETIGVKALIKFKEGSKHIGIFPEQIKEWEWVRERVMDYESRSMTENGEKKEMKVLNLFGYTGIASLVAAKAGGEVTHIDASKQSIEWAKENQKLSGLTGAPIRWITDDVIKFLKREVKREEKYDAIIMDPPSYGKGPKGEVWKAENRIPDLLELCKQILSDQPNFIILNMYSTELSSLSLGNLLKQITKNLKGTIGCGELAIKQENSSQLLPMSIFAIWQK